MILANRGRLTEAETALADALVLNKKWPNPDNENVATTLQYYARYHEYTGQYDKGFQTAHEAYDMDVKVLGAANFSTIDGVAVMVDVMRAKGQSAKAELLAREMVASVEGLAGPEHQDHPQLLSSWIALAEVLRESGKYAEA